ncbi:MAG: hypothetical protein U0637_03195 [Phycisphaerales bacterium]
MILTDTEPDPWNDASTGTLSVRRCVVQQVGSWRVGVVPTARDDGLPYEYIRYSPYGIPTSYPAMVGRWHHDRATTIDFAMVVRAGVGARRDEAPRLQGQSWWHVGTKVMPPAKGSA